MMVWKMICLFQGCILRFHVNLPGCIPLCTGFHTCFWCFAGFLNHQLPSLSGCDLAISSSWNWIAPGAVLKRKEQPNRERNMFNTTTLSHQQHQLVYHINIPGTQMTSIFESQPPKTRPTFQSKQGSVGFQVHIPHITHINDDEPPGFNERSRRSLPPFNQPIRRVDI